MPPLALLFGLTPPPATYACCLIPRLEAGISDRLRGALPSQPCRVSTPGGKHWGFVAMPLGMGCWFLAAFPTLGGLAWGQAKPRALPLRAAPGHQADRTCWPPPTWTNPAFFQAACPLPGFEA